MKIHSYDSDSQSLEVSFASTELSSQDPNQYERFSFNVDHYHDISSKDELVKKLLQSGSSLCTQIKEQEDVRNDTTKQTWFSELVDTTHNATTESLVEEPEVTYTHEVTL